MPLGQGMHGERPSPKVPGAHAVQEVDPDSEYEPAAHSVHVDERLSALNVPLGQCMHGNVPLLNVPGLHSTHAEDPG